MKNTLHFTVSKPSEKTLKFFLTWPTINNLRIGPVLGLRNHVVRGKMSAFKFMMENSYFPSFATTACTQPPPTTLFIFYKNTLYKNIEDEI